jgi:hypothetical protein
LDLRISSGSCTVFPLKIGCPGVSIIPSNRRNFPPPP